MIKSEIKKGLRMNKKEITEKVIYAIKESLNTQDIDIDLSTNLVEDLDMDSVDGITLIIDLEEELDIKIKDEEFAKFTTVESVVDYLENELKKRDDLCNE